MARYHINPETGRPNQCTAKVQCRFGSETQHFDSKESARAGYEKQMQGQTVSGSLKKTVEPPEHVPAEVIFDKKAVEAAAKEIDKIGNGVVSIELASEFMGDDSPELVIAFGADHDLCIIIEEEDGKKVAYTGYGIDPTANRWPVSDFVTAERIDEMAMANESYHPEAWRQEPSPQGQKIARLINAVAARPVGASDVPKAPASQEPTVRDYNIGRSQEEIKKMYEPLGRSTKSASSKTVPVAPAAPKPLAVIPGVPPVSLKQELDMEQGELEEDLHGFTVKGLLNTRDIGLREIEEEERSGNYHVTAKVPSYYEVGISTDLARRELGLPARPKTGIDESPLRLAEIAKNEAYSKTFGIFHSSEESRAAREKYAAARDEYYRIRDEEKNRKK